MIRTAPPAAALKKTLELGADRIRAFLGGVVTSSGLALFFDHWGSNVVHVVAAGICITIAIWPATSTSVWHSSFLTGLGLALLLTDTFLWWRPHDTGATGKWLIAVAVGSLLFWLLPGRRGGPAFFLTMLLAAMVGLAMWDVNTTVDGSDHVVSLVWHYIGSIAPSVMTLVVVAIAYTLCGMALDLGKMRGGAGTVFAAAIVGAGWAEITVDQSQGHVVGLLVLTGVLLTFAGYLEHRQIVGSAGLLICGVSVVRLFDAAGVTGDDLPSPDLPVTALIGVVLIVFGVLLGRGVHGR
jgi:hypothetical protein